MSEVRDFLRGVAEATSLTDVNIAAGILLVELEGRRKRRRARFGYFVATIMTTALGLFLADASIAGDGMGPDVSFLAGVI